MPGKPCSAVGCAETCGRSFMCRTHWFKVPRILRQRINETWRAWQKRSAGEGQERWLDYIEARDDATKSVAEQEGKLDGFTPELPRLKALAEMREARP